MLSLTKTKLNQTKENQDKLKNQFETKRIKLNQTNSKKHQRKQEQANLIKKIGLQILKTKQLTTPLCQLTIKYHDNFSNKLNMNDSNLSPSMQHNQKREENQTTIFQREMLTTHILTHFLTHFFLLVKIHMDPIKFMRLT